MSTNTDNLIDLSTPIPAVHSLPSAFLHRDLDMDLVFNPDREVDNPNMDSPTTKKSTTTTLTPKWGLLRDISNTVDHSVTPKQQQQPSMKLLKNAISNSVANQNQDLVSMLDYLVSTPNACGVMADTPTQCHTPCFTSALASKSSKAGNVGTTTWQNLEPKQLKRGPTTPLKTPRRTAKVAGRCKRRPIQATPGNSTFKENSEHNFNDREVLEMPISSFETPARSVAAEMAKVERDAALWGVLNFGDEVNPYEEEYSSSKERNNKNEEDEESEGDYRYPGTPDSIIQLRCELAKSLQVSTTAHPLTRLRHRSYETEEEESIYESDYESESEVDETYISTTSNSNNPNNQTSSCILTNSKSRPCIARSPFNGAENTTDYIILDSLNLQQTPALNPFLALKKLTLQKEYDAWLYRKEIEEWQERVEFVELEKRFL